MRMEQQEDVLAEFWERADKAKTITDRLDLLREFADRRVVRVKAYRTIRRSGPRQTWGKWVCWACRRKAQTVCHHIVQVQHGGTNAEMNRTRLCRGCHAVVHPWLRDKDDFS